MSLIRAAWDWVRAVVAFVCLLIAVFVFPSGRPPGDEGPPRCP
jgi:hypothetical protein